MEAVTLPIPASPAPPTTFQHPIPVLAPSPSTVRPTKSGSRLASMNQVSQQKKMVQVMKLICLQVIYFRTLRLTMIGTAMDTNLHKRKELHLSFTRRTLYCRQWKLAK